MSYSVRTNIASLESYYPKYITLLGLYERQAILKAEIILVSACTPSHLECSDGTLCVFDFFSTAISGWSSASYPRIYLSYIS